MRDRIVDAGLATVRRSIFQDVKARHTALVLVYQKVAMCNNLPSKGVSKKANFARPHESVHPIPYLVPVVPEGIISHSCQLHVIDVDVERVCICTHVPLVCLTQGNKLSHSIVTICATRKLTSTPPCETDTVHLIGNVRIS